MAMSKRVPCERGLGKDMPGYRKRQGKLVSRKLLKLEAALPGKREMEEDDEDKSSPYQLSSHCSRLKRIPSLCEQKAKGGKVA